MEAFVSEAGVEKQQDRKICSIPLSHGLLLQPGLGAGEKTFELGWEHGHWRLESPRAVQVQVNGHCRSVWSYLVPARVGRGAKW